MGDAPSEAVRHAEQPEGHAGLISRPAPVKGTEELVRTATISIRGLKEPFVTDITCLMRAGGAGSIAGGADTGVI